MRKIVLQVVITTASDVETAVIRKALDIRMEPFRDHHNLCYEVSIVQDGQLESLPEPAHVSIPHYMPGDINNPLIPMCRD